MLAHVTARPLYVIGHSGDSLRLEKNKCHTHPQGGQEGGSEELDAGQPQLSPWGGHTANPLSRHFQTQEGQEVDWEQQTRIYQRQIVPSQSEHFL